MSSIFDKKTQKNREILIGQIYWAVTKSNHRHPHVILALRGNQVEACQITTNRRKLGLPGIVALDKGEGNLKQFSLVQTSKSTWLAKSKLGELIGRLSSKRMAQVAEEAVKFAS